MPFPVIPVAFAVLTKFAIWGAREYVTSRKEHKDELNERLEKERREWRQFNAELVSSQTDKAASLDSEPIFHRNSAAQTPQTSPSSLEIQNENGEMALSISEIMDPRPRRWTTVDESEKNPISRLNSLLSAVPLAAISGDVSTTKYMVVQCTGVLTKAKNGEWFTPLVHGKKGIVEQAKLFSPEQLTRIVTVGALWQIASIAMAQKHLHDINEKLQMIDRKVEEIHTYQKNERKSKISACRKYFQQIYDDIKQGYLSNDSQNVIENQCVELMGFEGHLRDQAKEAEIKMTKSQLGKDFDEMLQQWVEKMREWFICIETRLLGYQLMVIMGADAIFLDNRVDEIRRDMESRKSEVILFSDYIVETLVKKASFWGNLDEVEQSLAVLQDLQIPDTIGKSFDHAREEVSVARSIVEQRKTPQEILLKVNGGQIEGYSVVEN